MAEENHVENGPQQDPHFHAHQQEEKRADSERTMKRRRVIFLVYQATSQCKPVEKKRRRLKDTAELFKYVSP